MDPQEFVTTERQMMELAWVISGQTAATNRQNYCNAIIVNLPAASPAHSARDLAAPASYAFAIKGRTHGQNCADDGYPLAYNSSPEGLGREFSPERPWRRYDTGNERSMVMPSNWIYE